jgi:HlyD family secretion protein
MKKVIIIVLVLAVFAVIIIANITSGKDEVEVQTEKIFRSDITEKVTGNGKIYPVLDVDISAKVSGEILAIYAEEGDTVNVGKILVNLDNEQYVALRDRAKSSIDGAEADLKLGEKELERAKDLYQKNLISQAELEIAEAKAERAISQLNQALASLKEAEDALDKTILRAPMKGVIIRKNKDVGEMALGSQFQADMILGLADLSKMEASIEVNENDIVKVSVEDTCEVEIDAFQDSTFLGIVSEIGHSAETKGVGTIEEVTNYEVKILLLDKLPSFRPGMSATADIRTHKEEDVLNVPIQCLTARERKKLEKKKKVETTPSERESEEETNMNRKKSKKEGDLVEVVFVVEENTARMRPVKVGISDDNYYQVLDGLVEGEEVITGPFRLLSRTLEDGDLIKVNNKEKSPVGAKRE